MSRRREGRAGENGRRGERERGRWAKDYGAGPGANGKPLAAGGTVDDDVHCRTCGYNLRTLRTDGKCPECGEAVSDSIPREWPHAADAKWLSTIRMGLGMSVAGCLAGAAQIDRSTPWPAQLPQSKLHSIALVLLAGGAWAMSAVASGEALIPAASRRRNRMRWLFAIALAVRLFDWLLVGVGSFRLSIDYSRVATWGSIFAGRSELGCSFISSRSLPSGRRIKVFRSGHVSSPGACRSRSGYSRSSRSAQSIQEQLASG